MVTAAGEGDPGSGDEVLHGARYKDLGGLCEGCDAVCDVHGGTGDVVAGEVDFAGVDSGSYLDSERGSVVANGGCAADRLPGRLEGGEDGLVGALDQAAAVRKDLLPRCRVVRVREADVTAPASIGCGRRGADRLGEQDRDEYAVGIAAWRCAGEKDRDLVTERVAVSAFGELQGVVAWLLEIAGAGNVGCQVASVEGRRDAVVETLDYKRRHVNGGQHGANVDLVNHPGHAQECAGAYRHALESREQLACAWRVCLAGEVPLDGFTLPPAVRGDIHKSFEHLV